MKPKTAAEFDDAARRAADASTSSTSQESSAVDIAAPAPPGEPLTAVQPERDTPPSETVQLPPPAEVERTYNNKKTPEEQTLAFLALVDGGIRPRAAAAECGLNIRTAYGILARSDGDVEATRGAVLRLLQAQALERLEDWKVASDVGARKKGNHAPARDWLMHAGVLDPLATDASVNVRVAICIGTDERPMRIASPLHVARTQGDTDDMA